MTETHLDRLTRIGIALSGEKNIDVLLDMIVTEAMSLTHSDAGTLYLVNESLNALEFAITHNSDNDIFAPGNNGGKLPPVPLSDHDGPNHKNVSSHVALTGNIVNIDDVYQMTDFDFSGTRKYDAVTGYRSRSMLVIPMQDHLGEIIGVIQLINATDPQTGEYGRFSGKHAELVASIASQAAVALNNARLIKTLEDLLFSFIKSIAAAIDAKSKFTGNHIRRVAHLTMEIAGAVNAAKEGVFETTTLSDDQMKELSMASWLHDVGKIVTPQHLIDKRFKLEGVADGIELIKARFQVFEASLRRAGAEEMLEAALQGKGRGTMDAIESRLEDDIRMLRSDLDFLVECNTSGEYLSDDKLERLAGINGKSFMLDGQKVSCLEEEEFQKLSIRKGNLTKDEREVIEDHAQVTWEILSKLPFPRNIGRVAEYASQHHERLDGSGYVRGLTEKELSLQSRILAIADIFEALTASDRPYKKPMPISMALKIMENMKKDGHLDPDLLEFFISNKVFMEFVRKEIDPSQNDVE